MDIRMKQEKLLDKFLVTYFMRDLAVNEKEAKQYIKDKKFKIRILESKQKQFLSIFRNNSLFYQQPM